MTHIPSSPSRNEAVREETGIACLFVIRLVFLCFSLSIANIASAANAIDAWRAEVASLRILVENDSPAARDKGLGMLAQLPSEATPVDEARLLNVISRAEIYMGLVREATANARRALDIATRSGDRIVQVEANLNIALNSVNEGNIEAMTTATTTSVELVDGLERADLVTEALMRMAMLYTRRGQVDEAIAMSMQALEIAKRSGNAMGLTYAYHGVAVTNNVVGHGKEAHDSFVMMRDAARAAGSRMLERYALLGIAQALMSAGDVADGEAHIREVIAIFRAVGAPFAVNHARFVLADSLRNRGKYANALSLFSETVDLYAKYPSKIGLWYSLVARSDVHRTLGNHPSAVADAESAYALSKEIGMALYEVRSAQQVATLHADHGEYKQAYTLAAAAAALINRTEREKASARVIELAQKYETESKRRQIEELTRRNELQHAELRHRETQQRLLWSVLGGSVAILAIIVFFLVRLRRSHAIIRELNMGLEQKVQSRVAELRQQTRYLRTLIDSLPWWVWLKDTTGRYLAVNETAANAFKLGTHELGGKSDKDVLPADAASTFEADDAEVMSSRRSKNIEEVQITPYGPVWMETFKAPVLDEDGTVLGTVGFARDISERKALDAAREAALADAQRVAQLRSDFLAQISHELRTPLNGILGYAQILQNDQSLNERQEAGVNVIRQSGEHLLTLINDILDSAKVEAGKLELYLEDIPLRRFLQTIADMIKVKAMQKGIGMVTDLSPDLPAAVRGDEKRLRQVLLNLLANAIKFTDRGAVTLRVTEVAPERFHFEVRDSGIGMREEHLKEIFQPFAQTGEVQRRLGGTGLGLTISRQFVRLMGGDIQVESRLGEGSCFSFELDLPVTRIEIHDSGGKRIVVGYEGPRRSILVVDDVEENSAMVRDMLGQLGFKVYAAANGAEALRMAPRLMPDLILMDVVMPEMDGIETTRRLRALPQITAVPVIAVSASSADENRKRLLSAEMNGFLSKPLVREKLLGKIESLLGLTWVHEAVHAYQTDTAESADQLVPPPADEMEVLRRLARLGNMDEIQERAAYLMDLDRRYRPFAERLSTLAQNYQSKAIMQFVMSRPQRS